MADQARRGARTVRRALAVGAALALGGVAWWYVVGGSEPVPWHKPARVDGATIRLSYTGSDCRDGARAQVEERADRVVVTVRETVRARSCNDMGVEYDLVVHLEAPLGRRTLVDGACEDRAYARRPDCARDVATVTD